MTSIKPTLAAAALAALTTVTHAQDTVDVGVLRNQDIQVVQKLLYPKAQRSELGLAVGAMPFDAYTTTPMGTFSFARHMSESFGAELALSGGYGLKNGVYRELEGPAYGIAPDAYRFLGAALVDAQWSPIYAKLNWRGKRVIHHDVYGLGGLGATIEQAMLPDKSIAVAPTLGLGIGARVFMGERGAIRVQLRDDLIYETRVKTLDSKGHFLKQNVAITVGYSIFGGK